MSTLFIVATDSGRTLFATLRQITASGTLGNYWNVTTGSWVASAPSITDRKITITEGTTNDIGAYTGIYAIGAALMGATVWAFEPYPVTFERLHHNAELNGIGTTGREGLTSVMNAVSAEAGDALLCHDRPRGFPSAASLERSGRYGVQVTTVALDQLTLPGRVSVMKIDVERHEPAVLRGAAALLERDRPVLIVESLGPAEERAILAAAPDYRIMNRLDRRNLLLERS